MRASRQRTFWAVSAIIGTVALVAACGGDDSEDTPNNGATPDMGSQPTAGPSGGQGGQGDQGGTITIGDQTWTIVPTIQCGNYYEQTGQVYISGVAAEDENIEISIDYDDSLKAAAVGHSQSREAPQWQANEDSGITFEVDGDTIRGSGTFIDFLSLEEQPGSFEVTC